MERSFREGGTLGETQGTSASIESDNREQRTPLPVTNVFALPPPQERACQVHLTLTKRDYCRRPLFEANRCYWHSESTKKYDVQAVESYFGAGATLKSAIETEVAGGHSLEMAYLVDAPLGGNLQSRGCNLHKGNLVRANLSDAHLSYSDLRSADFSFAILKNAYLSDCNITGARFVGARLFGTKFRGNTFSNVVGLTRENFKGLRWGWWPTYQILEDYPVQCEPVYRSLAVHFSSNGLVDDASWAAYRSCLMRHRLLKERLSGSKILADELVSAMLTEPEQIHTLLNSFPGIVPRRVPFRLRAARIMSFMEWLKSCVLWLLMGYGEKPLRVLFNAILTILLYAIAYKTFGAISDNSFISCLYFSAITFTTVGYGDLTPHGGFRLVAASEALAGIFLCGLFLFCLGRRSVGRG